MMHYFSRGPWWYFSNNNNQSETSDQNHYSVEIFIIIFIVQFMFVVFFNIGAHHVACIFYLFQIEVFYYSSQYQSFFIDDDGSNQHNIKSKMLPVYSVSYSLLYVHLHYIQQNCNPKQPSCCCASVLLWKTIITLVGNDMNVMHMYFCDKINSIPILHCYGWLHQGWGILFFLVCPFGPTISCVVLWRHNFILT